MMTTGKHIGSVNIDNEPQFKNYRSILALIRKESGPIEFFEGERFTARASASPDDLHGIAFDKTTKIFNKIKKGYCKFGVANWNWHYVEVSNGN